jgi:hypothetical protein
VNGRNGAERVAGAARKRKQRVALMRAARHGGMGMGEKLTETRTKKFRHTTTET